MTTVLDFKSALSHEKKTVGLGVTW